VLERAWSTTRVVADDGATADDVAALLAVQGGLAASLRTASHVRGPGALDARWTRTYAHLPVDDDALAAAEEAATPAQRSDAQRVEEVLRNAGYGVGLAVSVARAVGWRRVAAALTVERGLIGLVAAPLALADGDGIACDGPEALFRGAAAGITLLGAVAPAAVAPIGLTVGALSGLAYLFGGCRRQEPRPNETRPTVDPATGQSRLPSGHASNPHVDVAGVPLPPSYG
jgi:hypothetical protein